MAEFKLVISNPKNGLSAQREVKDQNAKALIGMKIGDKFNGELISMPGFEFEISGGSDYCGFPMRKDVKGIVRKKILAVSGIGIHKVAKGVRQRKTVSGNTVHERTGQVNIKVLKEGKEVLFENAQKKVEERAAAKLAKKAQIVEVAAQ